MKAVTSKSNRTESFIVDGYFPLKINKAHLYILEDLLRQVSK